MTQAAPDMGRNAPARQDGPTPAVAARHARPVSPAREIEPNHPEADLARRAAVLLSLFREALGFMADEADCPHLSDSLWEQVGALEDVPLPRAPLPDAEAELRDTRTRWALEDRAGRGRGR
ncbi:MAG: hypothetical protein K2X11_18920 [Acetobacteraceae bacterium]|nr:hypothetical protein [Acetobacteraceae bacterium]